MRLTVFLLIVMIVALSTTACTIRSVEPTANDRSGLEPDEPEPAFAGDPAPHEDSDSSVVFEPPVVNAIVGEAAVSVMRPKQDSNAEGNDLETCAGEDALLVKLSESTTEQIGYYMGNTDRTSLFLPDGSAAFGSDLKIDRKSLCDAAGRFEFRDLPDDKYVVIVPVPGGKRLFLERLSVAGGEVRELRMFYRWSTPLLSIE